MNAETNSLQHHIIKTRWQAAITRALELHGQMSDSRSVRQTLLPHGPPSRCIAASAAAVRDRVDDTRTERSQMTDGALRPAACSGRQARSKSMDRERGDDSVLPALAGHATRTGELRPPHLRPAAVRRLDMQGERPSRAVIVGRPLAGVMGVPADAPVPDGGCPKQGSAGRPRWSQAGPLAAKLVAWRSSSERSQDLPRLPTETFARLAAWVRRPGRSPAVAS